MIVNRIIKNKLTFSITVMTLVTVIFYFNQSSLEPSEDGLSSIVSQAKSEQPYSRIHKADDTHRETTTQMLGFESKFGGLPESLSGTVLVNALQVDENGHLIISNSIKNLFDYFLSTITEEELDLILLRVDEYLNHSLQEPALSESQAILAQYIDLKSALMVLEQDMAGALSDLISQSKLDGAYLEFLRSQLDQRNALREQYLDAEVYTAFYAEEERYDDYTYSRLLITADESLSEDERRQRIAELQTTLPVEVIQSMQKTQITNELKERTERLLANGGDHQEVRELRREMFGDDAVQRFDELDQQRAQWKTRIDAYLAQRAQILNHQGLVKEALNEQVDVLRSELFDEREQIRVRSLERHIDI